MLIEKKKISGVLIETIDINNQVGVVIGIGINVHMSEEEGKEINQSWISLDQVTDSINDRNEIIGDILNKIFITRPLPPTVLKKAETLGEVTARSLTSPLTTREMTEALQNFDIILPTLGDLFSESIFQKVTKIRCKLLANFGAGYNLSLIHI